MESSVMIQIIEQFGFPVLACGALAFYIYKILEQMRTSVEQCTKAVLLLSQKMEILFDVRGTQQKNQKSEPSLIMDEENTRE